MQQVITQTATPVLFQSLKLAPFDCCIFEVNIIACCPVLGYTQEETLKVVCGRAATGDAVFSPANQTAYQVNFFGVDFPVTFAVNGLDPNQLDLSLDSGASRTVFWKVRTWIQYV